MLCLEVEAAAPVPWTTAAPAPTAAATVIPSVVQPVAGLEDVEAAGQGEEAGSAPWQN